MKITKNELIELYHSHSNKDAAEKLGISTVWLWRLITKYGIEPKGRGNRAKKNKLVITDG